MYKYLYASKPLAILLPLPLQRGSAALVVRTRYAAEFYPQAMTAVTQEQVQLQVQAARDQMQAQMQAASAHSDTQLASANAQILYLSQMLESVRADQERLRRESEAAFNSFESRSQGRTGGTREREVSFVNMKSFEGGRFAGGKAESFQAWAKRVRIYCDALSSGCRKQWKPRRRPREKWMSAA